MTFISSHEMEKVFFILMKQTFFTSLDEIKVIFFIFLLSENTIRCLDLDANDTNNLLSMYYWRKSVKEGNFLLRLHSQVRPRVDILSINSCPAEPRYTVPLHTM